MGDAKISNGKEVLKCNVCNRRFDRRSRLVAHYKTHTGERPYSCPFCSKCFASKGNCNTHVRVHTRERPYECSHCGKKFSQHGQMVIHVRRHTGEKPYICPHCKKGFTCSKVLKIHVRTHTGEKPYICDFCTKGFAAYANLVVHRRIHTRERPYTCKLCGRAFEHSGNLVRHERGHHVDGGLRCIPCGRLFKQICDLTKHMSSCHPYENSKEDMDESFVDTTTASEGQKTTERSMSLNETLSLSAKNLPRDLSLMTAVADSTESQIKPTKEDFRHESPDSVFAPLSDEDERGKKQGFRRTASPLTISNPNLIHRRISSVTSPSSNTTPFSINSVYTNSYIRMPLKKHNNNGGPYRNEEQTAALPFHPYLSVNHCYQAKVPTEQGNIPQPSLMFNSNFKPIRLRQQSASSINDIRVISPNSMNSRHLARNLSPEIDNPRSSPGDSNKHPLESNGNPLNLSRDIAKIQSHKDGYLTRVPSADSLTPKSLPPNLIAVSPTNNCLGRDFKEDCEIKCANFSNIDKELSVSRSFYDQTLARDRYNNNGQLFIINKEQTRSITAPNTPPGPKPYDYPPNVQVLSGNRGSPDAPPFAIQLEKRKSAPPQLGSPFLANIRENIRKSVLTIHPEGEEKKAFKKNVESALVALLGNSAVSCLGYPEKNVEQVLVTVLDVVGMTPCADVRVDEEDRLRLNMRKLLEYGFPEPSAWQKLGWSQQTIETITEQIVTWASRSKWLQVQEDQRTQLQAVDETNSGHLKQMGTSLGS